MESKANKKPVRTIAAGVLLGLIGYRVFNWALASLSYGLRHTDEFWDQVNQILAG